MDAIEAMRAAPLVVPPRREPPEREPSLGAYLRSIRDNALIGWPARAYEEPITRRRLLGRTSFTVSDPDAIRRVLVDNQANYARTSGSVRILRPILGEGLLISEGSAWRYQRRALAPAFTPKAIDGLADHIASSVEDGLADLDAEAAAGPVQLFAFLHRLALEIAGRSMFSVAMESHGPELRRFIAAYSVRLGRPHLLDILIPLRWPAPLDLPRALFRRRWTPFLDRIIAARAAEAAPREARDLLDLLLAVRNPETGEAFSYAELRDQVATMILAGHETTAVALFWALYLLALDPATQEQVAAEARGADLREPAGCAGDGRLPLTRAVVDETLRLYPPAFLIVRRALQADTIAGHAVAAGDIVMIPPWVLHRHRRLWPNPDAFDPARFLPGAPAVPRYAYLPFGVGPRVCIGAQFALTEAVLALARIVGRYRIALAEDGPVLPLAVVTTQPVHAPPFRLERRSA
ncbi:cytochrome P450 [Methylobacterium symbioticum]|uniref:Cytochrome P450 132 n=1 Tax=Methylobacterium symbioticum TaxID=2584084 RepID=A0A509E987_9HYPH|nr:cytochrome P450 [Methylobacterium symbioticum]VUD70761.1 Putative cytochrome P450 132 [Methylobacterium symbioticum]